MRFHPSLGYKGRENCQSIVDSLPDTIRTVFLEYLEWRNAPISPLDYKLACTFRDRSNSREAGEKTEVFLCESLREAMQNHTVIGTFRHHFDAAWKRRMPPPESRSDAKKKRLEISAQSFRERQLAGGTYSGNESTFRALDRRGHIHRKPGRA